MEVSLITSDKLHHLAEDPSKNLSCLQAKKKKKENEKNVGLTEDVLSIYSMASNQVLAPELAGY